MKTLKVQKMVTRNLIIFLGLILTAGPSSAAPKSTVLAPEKNSAISIVDATAAPPIKNSTGNAAKEKTPWGKPALGIPPKGPPPWVTPPKGPPSCAVVKTATIQACCPDINTQGESSTSSVFVTECFDRTVEVPCRYAEGMIAEKTQELESGGRNPIGGSCTTALIELADSCPPGTAKKFECPDQTEESLEIYPLCETLEAMNESFQNGSCPGDSLGKIDFWKITGGGSITWAPDLEGGGVYTPGSSDSNGTGDVGTEIQPPGYLSEINQSNEPIPQMRLEMPGNFLRFFLTNTLLRPAVKELPKTVARDMPNPALAESAIRCDDDALSCSVNPLHVVDVIEVLHQAAEENGSGFTATGGGSAVWLAFDDARAHMLREGSGWKVDRFEYTLPGYLSVEWRGNYRLSTQRNLTMNLGDSTLNIRPVHDPEDRNGYQTDLSELDANGRWLDRSLLYPNLSRAECLEARGENSGEYRTDNQPYLCNCSQDFSYCLVDPFKSDSFSGVPAAAPMGSLPDALRPNDPPHKVFCTDSPVVRASITSTAEGTYEVNKDWPLDEYLEAINVSASEEQIGELTADILNFACTGSRVRRIITEDNVQTGSFHQSAVTSSAGLEFTTTFGGPILEFAFVDHGWITFELEIFLEAEQWLQKRWYTSWLSWFMKLVRTILSAVGTMTGNSVMLLAHTVPNVLEIELSDIQLDLTALAGHSTADVHELEAGLRRAAMSQFKVERTELNFNILEALIDNCQVGEYDNALDFILELLGTALDCIRTAVQSVIQMAMSPLWELCDWIFDAGGIIGEIITTSMNQPLRQNADNLMAEQDIPTMLAKSVQSFLLTPNLSVAPASADALDLEFPFDHLCSLTNGTEENLACIIEELYTTPIDPKLDGILQRVGAKTHWASDYDWGLPLDWNYPPVRYCAVGDTPPYSLDYTKANLDEINILNDEIKVIPSDGDMPEVSRTQCALFADLSLGGNLKDETGEIFEIEVSPTRRSEYLINRVFTCVDDSECELPANSDNLKGSKIYKRAALARCSLIADIWFKARTDLNGPTLDDMPFSNLLPVLQDGTWSTGDRAKYIEQLNLILEQRNSPVSASDIVDQFENCSVMLKEAEIPVKEYYGEKYGDVEGPAPEPPTGLITQ